MDVLHIYGHMLSQHSFPFFSCNSLYFSLGSTSPLSVHRSKGLYPRLQEWALCSNMQLRPDQLSHFFLLVTVIGRVIGSIKVVVIILNLDCWETTEKNPLFLLSNLGEYEDVAAVTTWPGTVLRSLRMIYCWHLNLRPHSSLGKKDQF